MKPRYSYVVWRERDWEGGSVCRTRTQEGTRLPSTAWRVGRAFCKQRDWLPQLCCAAAPTGRAGHVQHLGVCAFLPHAGARPSAHRHFLLRATPAHAPACTPELRMFPTSSDTSAAGQAIETP